MKRMLGVALVAAAMATGSASPASAQQPGDPAARIAAQKAALKKLSSMDGVWRGQGWSILPSGEKHTVTQTERVGPFLDGAVKVVEGRGYDAGGRVAFNAFGIISFDPDKQAYSMRSYTQGRSGDFPVTVTADGFAWEIAAGPATIRYAATVKDGKWHEVGDRIVADGKPVRFFEMTLERVGDTDWPAAGAIPMK